MTGFIMWAFVGCFFIGLGIYCFFSKKAAGFWANVEMFKVNDLKKYNSAMGKLWIAFGILFIVLGIPLLNGQNSLLIMLSVIGVMIEVIAFMMIDILVIEKKYKK